MALTIELACTKSALVDQGNPNSNYSGQAQYDLYEPNGSRRLYLAFEEFPTALRSFMILSCQLVIKISGPPYEANLYDVESDFDPTTLTWNNQPGGKSDGYYISRFGGTTFYLPTYDALSIFDAAKRLRYPAFFVSTRNFSPSESFLADASTAKLVVSYDPDRTIVSQVSLNAPPSYVNPHETASFAWKITILKYSYDSVDGATQESAAFYWRSGTSGDFTEIRIPGTTQSVSIPADTFPSGTLQFYVEATDNFGTTSQTPVYTATTIDSLRSSEPISPINTVEDGNSPIVFSWGSSVNTGTSPTGADVRWRRSEENDQAWQLLGHVDGAESTLTAPANTFPAGTIQWMVRTYNADGDPGDWSSVATFISVAAPLAPSVNTDAAPFATITWQAEGQQAYRLSVDGKSFGPFFGTAKSFTLPDYLVDGEHVATVSVQGVYGLWSPPGEILFNVENAPGNEVTLQGNFGTDAELFWQTASTTQDFLIYRDGVRIGHTNGTSFVDRLVLGTHGYQVVNRLPDGNYTISSTVSGCLRSCVTQIAPAAGGPWLELRLSENQMNEEQFVYSRTYSLRHIAGAEYPVLELSPYLDGSGRYNTAFATLSEAQAFEALKGQIVILKSRGGNVMIGALTDLQKRNSEFYIAYEFTIQRCHWEDYIDDEDG